MDRPPFTFYHHYKRPTSQQEADDHLAFHRAYNTDIVKVMNDFDYPKSTTDKWYELKPVDSPYPGQLATLQRVRDGLNGDAYFIDTIYGPYMTAMILYQSQARFAKLPKSDEAQDEQIKSLHEFQQQNPEGWHTALEAITQSTLHHIRHAKAIGASGTLVSVFNAESKFGSVEDYEKYTRPYDKRVFEALADTPLTVLHLHYLERPYIGLFTGFPRSHHSALGENQWNLDRRNAPTLHAAISGRGGRDRFPETHYGRYPQAMDRSAGAGRRQVHCGPGMLGSRRFNPGGAGALPRGHGDLEVNHRPPSTGTCSRYNHNC